MRMRTIGQTAEYIKGLDPDTALTRTAIRRKVLSGEIPSTMAGTKYLIDLDRLEDYLFTPVAESKTGGTIRQVRV